MRLFAALLALRALGCSTSWQRIPNSSIKNSDADLLFVVTNAKAYVLVGSRFEAGVVHGVPDREWNRDPNAPVELFRPTESPEELAKQSHWTQVVPYNGDVKIPFSDIRYSSVGAPPSDPRVTLADLGSIVLGFLAALYLAAILTH